MGSSHSHHWQGKQNYASPPGRLITVPPAETLHLVVTQALRLTALMRAEAPGQQPRLTAQGDFLLLSPPIYEPHSSLPG